MSSPPVFKEGTWVQVAEGRWRLVYPDEHQERRTKTSTHRLDPEERKKVSTQLGVQVWDKDDMHRVAKEKDLHVLEAGEPGDIARRDLKKWRPGDPLPESNRPPPVRHPLDIHQIYRETERS